MTHQCPRCDLRFTTSAEVKHHMAVDHGVAAETLDRYQYRDAPQLQGLYPTLEDPVAEAPGVRRYLVVANRTLAGDTLLDELTRRAAAGRCSFFVIVPSTDGVATAEYRLRQGLDALAAAGVPAAGEVGDPDPVAAVAGVLRREPFDEILLSTLPAGTSPWLRTDIAARLRHITRLPVAMVVAPSDALPEHAPDQVEGT